MEAVSSEVLSVKRILFQGTMMMRMMMKDKLSFNMVPAAMGSVKSPALALLLLSSLICIVDSYPNVNMPNRGCDKCMLRKHDFFSKFGGPVYQCEGCCFSRAYPTPTQTKKSMPNPKNITSEATCCVAEHGHEIEILGIPIKNHTACHCSTCYHNKI
ncbi:glycoprotein hormones alpha chain [Gouania willdenowi]|uniref:Glycoprotein hormones alpha chain n=1 Tax=Gouania willdenowi TaxID=441366 RepID=A0A8C5GKR5_GOUWI|nr:glycoprotein hormones alpha chain [Gouania willdenowi]